MQSGIVHEAWGSCKAFTAERIADDEYLKALNEGNVGTHFLLGIPEQSDIEYDDQVCSAALAMRSLRSAIRS